MDQNRAAANKRCGSLYLTVFLNRDNRDIGKTVLESGLKAKHHCKCFRWEDFKHPF
jgi:hypothetical protein